MSVKVNLLPREVTLKVRERRVAMGSVTAVAVWVLLLALLYVQQLAAVGNARDERDQETVELARLQAEADRLAPYRELAQRYDRGNALLADAMTPQIAWSGVFNDLALVFPANSSLLTLNVTSAAAATEATLVDSDDSGAVTFTGYSVERYAPGVESVLLGMGDAAAFEDLYLNSAARVLIDQTPVTDFDGSARLNERVFTRRFVNGLPEDER